MARQVRFGYSFAMTRRSPRTAACSTLTGADPVPAGWVPRVTTERWIFSAVGRDWVRVEESVGVTCREEDDSFGRWSESGSPIVVGRDDAGGRKKLGEVRCESGIIRDEEPGLVSRSGNPADGDGWGESLAGEKGDLAFAAAGADEAGEGSRFLESGTGEDGFPLLAVEEGLVGSEVAVGEAPPSAGESEDGLGPELRTGGVHEDEAAAGNEEIVEVAEGGVDVGDGVEDVRAEDEVVRVGIESLVAAGFFEIEDFEGDFRVGGKLLTGRGEEGGGCIGESVGVDAAARGPGECGRRDRRCPRRLRGCGVRGLRGVGWRQSRRRRQWR